MLCYFSKLIISAENRIINLKCIKFNATPKRIFSVIFWIGILLSVGWLVYDKLYFIETKVQNYYSD